jgi:hypothetical protein
MAVVSVRNFGAVGNGTAKPVGGLQLRFRAAVTPPGAKPPNSDEEKEKAKFRGSLSGIAFAADGKTLFLGGDETVEEEPTIELLVQQDDGSYGGHQSLKVSDFIPLPDPARKDGRAGEIDIEGLDVNGGCLWLVGSHSCNRKQPKSDEAEAVKSLKRLAEVEEGPNRFFLGRIPLANDSASGAKLVKQSGGLQAGRVRGSGPNGHLVDELKGDEHFGPFSVPFSNQKRDSVRLPSKDNGLDIEGLTVAGSRVFIGLRGPVLRGWACILEVQVGAKSGDADLKLIDFGDSSETGESRKYRKHFIFLGGLGIRDLALDGDDFLILAGPTMSLDGPARVFRWKEALKTISGGDTIASAKANGPAKILELAVGDGNDHPEGLAILPTPEGEPKKVVIVYDSPAPIRFIGKTDITADMFALPTG